MSTSEVEKIQRVETWECMFFGAIVSPVGREIPNRIFLSLCVCVQDAFKLTTLPPTHISFSLHHCTKQNLAIFSNSKYTLYESEKKCNQYKLNFIKVFFIIKYSIQKAMHWWQAFPCFQYIKTQQFYNSFWPVSIDQISSNTKIRRSLLKKI